MEGKLDMSSCYILWFIFSIFLSFVVALESLDLTLQPGNVNEDDLQEEAYDEVIDMPGLMWRHVLCSLQFMGCSLLEEYIAKWSNLKVLSKKYTIWFVLFGQIK